MTTSLRLSQPRELLALVPHQLGFHPRESLVVMSLRAQNHRLGMIMRVDLAALMVPDDGERLALSLVGHLERDKAQQLVAVVYTSADPRPDPQHPVHEAVERLRNAAGDLQIVNVWAVCDTGYFELACQQSCCPPGGRSLTELEGTASGAQMVLNGSVVAASREDLGRIPPASGAHRRAVTRVRQRWIVRGSQAAATSSAELEHWRLAGLAAFRTELERVNTDPHSLRGRFTGRLEAALRDVKVRDAILVSLIPDTGELPEKMLRETDASPQTNAQLNAALNGLYGATEGMQPSALVKDSIMVLSQVVALGVRDKQAPALTLIALLHWWSGDGGRAGRFLEQAVFQEPQYRFAQLVGGLVFQGVPPGWVHQDD